MGRRWGVPSAVVRSARASCPSLGPCLGPSPPLSHQNTFLAFFVEVDMQEIQKGVHLKPQVEILV